MTMYLNQERGCSKGSNSARNLWESSVNLPQSMRWRNDKLLCKPLLGLFLTTSTYKEQTKVKRMTGNVNIAHDSYTLLKWLRH